MNAAYRTLMARLPAAAAARLRQSQRTWLAFRDAETRTRAAIYGAQQGTMFVPMAADAGMTVIADRARLLERYARLLEVDR